MEEAMVPAWLSEVRLDMMMEKRYLPCSYCKYIYVGQVVEEYMCETGLDVMTSEARSGVQVSGVPSTPSPFKG